MSRPFEHDYIGLSEVSGEETSEIPKIPRGKNGNKDLNFKATELRLGLPGSESPEREEAYPLRVLNLGFSGAKRGFSVAIDTDSNSGRGKWILDGNGGSDIVDLGKMGSCSNGGGLFSPRGVNGATKTINGSDPSSQEMGLVSQMASGKDGVSPVSEEKAQTSLACAGNGTSSAAKAQVVGWPPIRSFRKNTMAMNLPKNDHENKESKLDTSGSCLYVKVSMDGAPYLRKVDLKTYGSYNELSSSLEKMFRCFTIGQYGYNGVPSRDGLSESRLIDLLHGSEYVLTYEDKDGDWMLVGDVPWDMFTNSCKRLRIMKSSEAIGLAPRTMEKCKTLD